MKDWMWWIIGIAVAWYLYQRQAATSSAAAAAGAGVVAPAVPDTLSDIQAAATGAATSSGGQDQDGAATVTIPGAPAYTRPGAISTRAAQVAAGGFSGVVTGGFARSGFRSAA